MISRCEPEGDRGRGPVAYPRHEDPNVLHQVAQWAPRAPWPGGTCSPGPGPPGRPQCPDQFIDHGCKTGRGGRTLRGIDEQVAKTPRAVAGLASFRRARFIALDGAV
jgi:hypothetical protein